MPNALRLVLFVAELVEADPEDTFFHFVSGIWREAEARGDTCKVRRDMGIVPSSSSTPPSAWLYSEQIVWAELVPVSWFLCVLEVTCMVWRRSVDTRQTQRGTLPTARNVVQT